MTNRIIAQFTLCFAVCFLLDAIDDIIHKKNGKWHRITHLVYSLLNVAGIVYLILIYIIH